MRCPYCGYEFCSCHNSLSLEDQERVQMTMYAALESLSPHHSTSAQAIQKEYPFLVKSIVCAILMIIIICAIYNFL